MKKILFISHYAELYGANKSLLNIVNGLKVDFKLSVVLPSAGPICQELDDLKVPYTILNKYDWVVPEASTFIFFRSIIKAIRIFRATKRIVKHLKKEPVDFIYSNSFATPLGAILSKIIKTKHIWHVREFLELDYNLKVAFSLNITKFILGNKLNLFVTISNSVKNYYQKKYSILNMKTIYNGVISKKELSEISEIKQNIYDKSFTFLAYGLLHRNKGFTEIIDAFSFVCNKMPHAKLIIVGDGPNKQHIIQKISILGLEKQILLEPFTKNIQGFIMKANVILVASKHEAFGRVIVEAMSHKKIVISFNTGGTAEIIQHNVNGFLSDPNSKDFSIEILNVYQNFSNLEHISENAYQTVLENFTTDDLQNNIRKLLI